ncbi:unnamed protein product, partial [Ectocarpus sp. 12 AP-2014]
PGRPANVCRLKARLQRRSPPAAALPFLGEVLLPFRASPGGLPPSPDRVAPADRVELRVEPRAGGRGGRPCGQEDAPAFSAAPLAWPSSPSPIQTPQHPRPSAMSSLPWPSSW